jgi:uncharacterized protein (DUF952 family)
VILKILRSTEWAGFQLAEEFHGSPVDHSDGFIHLSTPAQVAETARKHFGGEEGLTLIAIDPAALDGALRWERSRAGALFPHVYGVLKMSHVLWAEALPTGPDGLHVLPGRVQ